MTMGGNVDEQLEMAAKIDGSVLLRFHSAIDLSISRDDHVIAKLYCERRAFSFVRYARMF